MITSLTLALAFIKDNWPRLSLLACICLGYLCLRGCKETATLEAKLAACEAKPAQIVTVAAKANQVVKVIYKDGSPCADIEASNNTESTATVSEAKAIPCPTLPNLGVWVGGGYIGTPYLSAGIEYKRLQVDAKRSLLEWGGEARYKLLEF